MSPPKWPLMGLYFGPTKTLFLLKLHGYVHESPFMKRALSEQRPQGAEHRGKPFLRVLRGRCNYPDVSRQGCTLREGTPGVQGHTVNHWTGSKFATSPNRPWIPLHVAPSKERQTPQSCTSNHGPQRITGGKTGSLEVLQKCRVWGKKQKGNK